MGIWSARRELSVVGTATVGVWLPQIQTVKTGLGERRGKRNSETLGVWEWLSRRGRSQRPCGPLLAADPLTWTHWYRFW